MVDAKSAQVPCKRLVSDAICSRSLFTFTEPAGAADDFNVTGEVGGSVSVNCPTEPNKKITFFYFQKVHIARPIYVNGFYVGKPTSLTDLNSSLDSEKNTTVHMFNLTMDHSGGYQCLLEYTDGSPGNTNVHIYVTGKNDRTSQTIGVLGPASLSKVKSQYWGINSCLIFFFCIV